MKKKGGFCRRRVFFVGGGGCIVLLLWGFNAKNISPFFDKSTGLFFHFSILMLS